MQVGAPALKHKPFEAAFAYLLFVVVVPQPRPERFAVLAQVGALLIGAKALLGHSFRLARRFFLSAFRVFSHSAIVWSGLSLGGLGFGLPVISDLLIPCGQRSWGVSFCPWLGPT